MKLVKSEKMSDNEEILEDIRAGGKLEVVEVSYEPTIQTLVAKCMVKKVPDYISVDLTLDLKPTDETKG